MKTAMKLSCVFVCFNVDVVYVVYVVCLRNKRHILEIFENLLMKTSEMTASALI